MLSLEPYISIATFAVVPEFLQTPVIIVISYSCKLFDPVGRSIGEPFWSKKEKESVVFFCSLDC